MCAYDGMWGERAAPLPSYNFSTMPLLHFHRLLRDVVDACKRETVYRHVCSFFSHSGLSRRGAGKPCKSKVFGVVLKIFFIKISQYLEMEESGKSRCCDFYVNQFWNRG